MNLKAMIEVFLTLRSTILVFKDALYEASHIQYYVKLDSILFELRLEDGPPVGVSSGELRRLSIVRSVDFGELDILTIAIVAVNLKKKHRKTLVL